MLVLEDSTKLEQTLSIYPTHKIYRYPGKQKYLLNYIDMIEKNDEKITVIIHYPLFDELKQAFKALYKTVTAAGGLVINELNEILFIYKRGYWDLPKGKLESKERKKQAAIREVEEETGVTDLNLEYKLCVTKHTYKTKSGIRAIKKSHWYLMKTHNQSVTPQAAEGIERVEWMQLNDMLKKHSSILYSNLKNVLQAYEQKLIENISRND